MTTITNAEMRAGLFIDPLADWPNDDLLISDASRDALRRTYPELIRVLDWSELREAFVRHDEPAGRNKRASHRQGLLAIAFAGIGIVLLGVTPVLSHVAEAMVSTIALLCMSIGGGLGVLHWVFCVRASPGWATGSGPSACASFISSR